jgi:hypothetical protein
MIALRRNPGLVNTFHREQGAPFALGMTFPD